MLKKHVKLTVCKTNTKNKKQSAKNNQFGKIKKYGKYCTIGLPNTEYANLILEKTYVLNIQQNNTKLETSNHLLLKIKFT